VEEANMMLDQIRRFVAPIALLLVAASVPSMSQATPDGSFHAPAPGTNIVWQEESHRGSSTSRNVFTGVEGFKILFKRGGVEEGAWIPFCYGCAHNIIDVEAYGGLWPLEVGKSVSFRRKREDGSREWAHVIKVVGTESVTVGAGSFDTFVVEETATSIGRSWRGTGRFWWAPSVGYIVKRDIEENEGTWSRAEVTELTPAQ
jgi:hypothetical protein